MKYMIMATMALFSYFAIAEDSSVTAKEVKGGLVGIFVAVPPYGIPLTNDLGVPYKIITYNHTDKPVAIDGINIAFETAGYDGDCDTYTQFSSEIVSLNVPVPMYARVDSTGLSHQIKFGALQGIPESMKMLHPGESFDLLFVSSSSLRDEGSGGGCLKPIEESLKYSVN